MPRRLNPVTDKLFLRPDYAVRYRAGCAFAWTHEARNAYGLLFVLRGEIGGAVNGENLALRAGEALLLNVEDAARMKARGEAITLNVELSPAFVLDAATRARLMSNTAVVAWRETVVRDAPPLKRLAEDLATELCAPAAGQEIVIAALLEQLTVYLLRHQADARRAPELELSRVGLVDRRIRRAVELMHARLAEELPLETLAAEAYLSPFHFARLFKKSTGATPHNYLVALRHKRAEQLLAQTDLSVTEIALRVGYQSSSHFTKAFRQTVGLSPRAFRAALVASARRP